MADNTENTEIKADVDKVGVSLRDSLQSKFSAQDEADRVEPDAVEVEVDENTEEVETEEAPNEPQQVTPQQTQVKTERLAVAPPGDMSKEEKEAFQNPTAENNHILQAYLSRRAYQTQSDYSRKMNELEQNRQKVSGLYNVIKDHESDYVRKGLNMADVTRRFIEWDKAMDANPMQTALEWLDAYEIDINDLVNMRQNGYMPQQQQPQQQYLTQADAERIAQEKIEAMIQKQQQSVLAETHHNAVQSFINSKPLFRDPGTAAQLEDAMAPIVAALSQQGGSPQDILETAYNYVTKGHPTFAALTQKLEAPIQVEQKVRQAQKAKAATKSISGGTGSGSPRLQTKDLRTNLQRRFNGGE
jgi:hypothetical protein